MAYPVLMDVYQCSQDLGRYDWEADIQALVDVEVLQSIWDKLHDQPWSLNWIPASCEINRLYYMWLQIPELGQTMPGVKNICRHRELTWLSSFIRPYSFSSFSAWYRIVPG